MFGSSIRDTRCFSRIGNYGHCVSLFLSFFHMLLACICTAVNGAVLFTPGAYEASTAVDIYYPANGTWALTQLTTARRHVAAYPMSGRYA